MRDDQVVMLPLRNQSSKFKMMFIGANFSIILTFCCYEYKDLLEANSLPKLEESCKRERMKSVF